MAAQILATKLYIPPPRPNIVPRPRLIGRLNEGLAMDGKPCVTLISASAGFGKTTLVSEWIATVARSSPLPTSEGLGVRAAWLSLDEGDNDPVRFISYVVAALQTIKAGFGEGVLSTLRTSGSQPPQVEVVLTALLNEISTIPDSFLLILDDYHVIDSKAVDEALTFLVERLPPKMHLVIATREDPSLPLARLRVCGQLTELRATDLQFTPAEATEFLNRVMGLNLSDGDVAALESRTEGWIAGLQLAALSMQGHKDTAGFIKSFTGSHRFVLDYLVEEVLGRQSENIQAFLLRTSILDRMCASLCDAVLVAPSGSGRENLEYIESANLFVVALDDERKWFRYHHLFAQLLRQRLHQSGNVDDLHRRASQWYEEHGLEVEAFHHAAAANDIERAERLIEGGRIPLHSRAAVTTVLEWLDFLPKAVLDARPWLWVKSAMLALNAGQTIGVEEKLHAAEKVSQNADFGDQTLDLMGQIAAVRATVALARYQPEAMITESRRALQHLHPDNLPFRSRALRALGFAYQLKGDRVAARQFYTEAMAIKQTPGNIHLTVSAITGIGNLQEAENQLHQAAETYRHALQLLSDQQPPNADQEYIGLARIFYEWNDLAAAEKYGQRSLQLARQYDHTVDRYIICDVFLARLKLAQGDVAGAAAMLEEAGQSVRRNNFVQRVPDIIAAQVITLLRQGDVMSAARLIQTHDLPLSQARVFLAQRDTSKALALLEPLRRQMEAKDWKDELLKVIVLEAVALSIQEEKERAVNLLRQAFVLAEPGGFIRTFIDEGPPMKQLLSDAVARGVMPGYANTLLDVFQQPADTSSSLTPSQPLAGPLSPRELEVLKLIAQGLSNREIGARLYLAVDTVKGHNRRIFDKLQVQRRTEAIARARDLDLL